MRDEERDPAWLWDMLEAARSVVAFTADLTLEEFLATGSENRMRRLAVERELEILGEAGNRISTRFHDEHPEFPWKDIIGLRNVISHQYDRISYDQIFRIVQERIPELILLLEKCIPPVPPIDE